MTVFSIDVKVAATLYVKADTEEAARELIKDFLDPDKPIGLEVGEYPDPPTDDIEDAYVSDKRFDDETLPIISISPSMTIWSAWDEDTPLEQLE